MSKHTEVNTGDFTEITPALPKDFYQEEKKILFFHLGVGHLEFQREHMVPSSFILGYFSVSVNGTIHPPLDSPSPDWESSTLLLLFWHLLDSSWIHPSSSPSQLPQLEFGYRLLLLPPDHLQSGSPTCPYAKAKASTSHSPLLLSLILRIKRKLLTKTSKGICSLHASSTSLLQLLLLPRAPSFHLPP